MPVITAEIRHIEDDGYATSLNDSPMWYDHEPNLCAGNNSTRGATGVSLRYFPDIPQMARIIDAYLVVSAHQSMTAEVARTRICCEDIGNSPRITNGPDYKNRPRTSSVLWDGIPPWPARGIISQSPSFPVPVQAVIDRPDWAPGNALMVFWEDLEPRSDPGVIRCATGFDFDPTSAPVLWVEFEVDPVVARFSADPVSGTEPLRVTFTDESIGTITSWLWDFGDGTASDWHSPVHDFTVPAGEDEHTFIVTLTVTGPEGQGSVSLEITVHARVTPQIPESTFFWTSTEMATILRTLASQPSHQEIWGEVFAWAAAHINDTPPAEPVGGGYTEYATAMAPTYAFINNMGFMAAMTRDTRYVEAAIPFLLAPLTWTTWDPTEPDHSGQLRAWMSVAIGTGYNFFRDSLTVEQRTAIINRLAIEVGQRHYEYYRYGTYVFDQWAERKATLSACLVFAGMAIVDDYPQAQAWIDFGTFHIEETLAFFFQTDGGVGSGGGYLLAGLAFLVPCLDVLRRMKGLDLFDARLANTAQFCIYMNYNHGPLQIEDTTWHMGYSLLHPWGISCVYKLASEYTDGYAQWFADFYAVKADMHTFIYKSPTLQALPISELPLAREFASIGYVISRSGWGDHDTLLLFKSGAAYPQYGHAHRNQNQFQIYNQGVPLTCGPGWLPYSGAEVHNCILLADDAGQDYTEGQIVSVEINDSYSYMSGEAAQCYEGRLSKCLRQVVFLTNLGYSVIYDQVVANAPEEIAWQITAPNTTRLTTGAGGTPLVRPAAISVNGDTIVITQRNSGVLATLTNVIVEPEGFTSERLPLAAQFPSNRVKVYPPTPATEAQFLNVQFPGAVLATEKVRAGNALGVIVRDGNYLDLILFGTDGAPVDQYIELGGAYEPIDGQAEFDGTRIRAQFNVYQVMRLREVPVTLTIVAGTGGTTEPSPGTRPYDQGSVVRVTAVPSAGYRFLEWQENGVPVSTDATVDVQMTTDRFLTATFEKVVVPPEQYAVTISVVGEGTTEPAPGVVPVVAGEELTVEAMAASGYIFDQWEGDISSSDTSVTFTVNQNLSIVARFSPAPPVQAGCLTAAVAAVILAIILAVFT